ncbi:probable RNA-binding protein 46 [Homarus americanus]|uniref:probable RNA-binding protein 46 n=1 Tax=Homarus americanus TaxID=6706 RepID=UPI001C43ED5F|nr:probable RNA-binding protein 46 [Homarus americanus]
MASGLSQSWQRSDQIAEEVERLWGCSVVQIKGQRVYGPRPSWSGPVPKRGSEVYVVNLPPDLLEDELLPVMERAGPVYMLRLIMNFSGANRGYAFVTFASPAMADSAIKLLNKTEIRPGCFLRIKLSIDNNRLFVANLPRKFTEEQVFLEMQRLTVGVVKVTMHHASLGSNYAYAFVEYESHSAAAQARRDLFVAKLTLWGSVRIILEWAKPKKDDNCIMMRKVRL